MQSAGQPHVRRKRTWITSLQLAISCLYLAGCGASSSPSAPTPAPTPSLPLTTFTLSGRVQEGVTDLPGVTVHVLDGQNPGRSTTTDTGGNYSLSGLQSGGFNVRFTLAGYDTVTQGANLSADQRLDVTLTRTPGPSPTPSPTPTGSGVVINEFRTRGAQGANDEFIELRNDSSTVVDIGGWQIFGSNGSGGTTVRRILDSGITLGPGCHYLLTNSNTDGYSGATAGDTTYGVAITDDGGIALRRADGSTVDQVGMSSGSAYREGSALDDFGSANTNRAYARTGNDTDSNRSDFSMRSPSTPQNRTSSCSTR